MVWCEKRGMTVEKCVSIKFCDYEECELKKIGVKNGKSK